MRREIPAFSDGVQRSFYGCESRLAPRHRHGGPAAISHQRLSATTWRHLGREGGGEDARLFVLLLYTLFFPQAALAPFPAPLSNQRTAQRLAPLFHRPPTRLQPLSPGRSSPKDCATSRHSSHPMRSRNCPETNTYRLAVITPGA